MSLTNIRDIDLKIISELSDIDVLRFSRVNKYTYSLLQNEFFWKNRFLKIFQESEDVKTPESWKQQYIDITKSLQKYARSEYDAIPLDYFTFLIDVNLISSLSFAYRNPDISLDYFSDYQKHLYFYLDLGNEISVCFPYNNVDLDSCEFKDYKIDTYFTPVKLMRIIYDFYQETLSVNEFKVQKCYENVLTDNFSIEDVKNGKVKKLDMLGNYKFDGFWISPEISTFAIRFL